MKQTILKTNLLALVLFSAILSGCSEAVVDEDLQKYKSNGLGGVSYYFNNQFVQEKHYGQILDGQYREGVVTCAYSAANDKFTVNMYIPETKEIGSFNNAAEGVFLEVYGRGYPQAGTYSILPAGPSRVYAMLPVTIVSQQHHFTSAATTGCTVALNNSDAKISGSLNCNNLVSPQVGGTLTVRADFSCEYL